MGIMEFFSKQKEAKKSREELRKSVENDLLEKMSKSPILDSLMAELDKNPWTLARQNQEDYGLRRVKLTADAIEIKWSKKRKESRVVGQNSWGIDQYKTEYIEDVFGKVAYSYTQSGYKPLAAYHGDVYIPQERVVELWGMEIMDRLAGKIPGCNLSKTYDGFEYTIPMPIKELF